MRNRSFLIRFILSVILIVVLLLKVDLSKIYNILNSASLSGLLVAFLFYLMTYFIITARWASILYSQGYKFPFFRLFAYYLVGFFFSNFIPTGIGGDVARCIYLSKGSKTPEFLSASVLVERFLGLIATTLIASLALPFSDFLWTTKRLVFLLTLLLWLLFLILIIPKSNRFVRKVAMILPGRKIKSFTDELIHSFSLFKLRSFLCGFIFSLLYQGSLIFFFFLVGRALNVELSLWNYLAFLPVIWIIGLLPISINAIGIREAGFAWMFSSLGQAPSLGFANSIIGFLLAVIASLAGGILFIFKGKLKSNEST